MAVANKVMPMKTMVLIIIYAVRSRKMKKKKKKERKSCEIKSSNKKFKVYKFTANQCKKRQPLFIKTFYDDLLFLDVFL